MSAAVRLIPSPPALVDSRKIGMLVPRPCFLLVDEDDEEEDDVHSDGDAGLTWLLQDEKRSAHKDRECSLQHTVDKTYTYKRIKIF